MLLKYKHKRGCTNDPESLGSRFKNRGSGEMYLLSVFNVFYIGPGGLKLATPFAYATCNYYPSSKWP